MAKLWRVKLLDALNGIAYIDDKQITRITAIVRYRDEPYINVKIMEDR